MNESVKSYVDILNEKNSIRRKKMQLTADVEKMRAYVTKLEEDKRQAAILEMRAKKEKDEELRLEHERMALEANIKRKTKTYFDINKYNRRIPEKDATVYFGDYETTDCRGKNENKLSKAAWIPSGHGEYFVNEEIRYEGNFLKGKLQGEGRFVLDNGSTWSGLFHNGMMDGIGVMTYPNGEKRDLLMRKNVMLCDRNEIQVGKQIEIFDPRYCPSLGGEHQMRVIVLKHVSGWTYLCRVQQEVSSRERKINFATLKSFEVLHRLPSVFFNTTPEPPERYDYYQDTYGETGRPNLGIAGGRQTADLRGAVGCHPVEVADRKKSDHKENLFESATVGLGAAIQEEKERLFKELQKKQMMELLSRRRAQEEESRKKRIAEEQERYLQEQLKQSAEARKQEQENFRQTLAMRLEKETSIWKAKEQAMEEKERLQRAMERGLGGLFEKGYMVFSGLRVEGVRETGWMGVQNLYMRLSLGSSLSCCTASVSDDGSGTCVWDDVLTVDGVSVELSIPVTEIELKEYPLQIQVWDAGATTTSLRGGQNKAKDVLLFEGSHSVAGLSDTRRDDVILQLRQVRQRPKSRRDSAGGESSSQSDHAGSRAFLAMILTESETELMSG